MEEKKKKKNTTPSFLLLLNHVLCTPTSKELRAYSRNGWRGRVHRAAYLQLLTQRSFVLSPLLCPPKISPLFLLCLGRLCTFLVPVFVEVVGFFCSPPDTYFYTNFIVIALMDSPSQRPIPTPRVSVVVDQTWCGHSSKMNKKKKEYQEGRWTKKRREMCNNRHHRTHAHVQRVFLQLSS